MSRPIKFRAWDSKADTPYMIDVDMMGFALGNYLTQDRYKVMQYTGLHDKDGVEIYEGDIVKGTVGGSTDAEIYPEEQTIKCEFEREGYWSIIRFNDDGEMEVIGNIYENPELLK